MTLNFEIKRDGSLFVDGTLVAKFTSEAEAANVAIRIAQHRGALYEIIYPL